MKLLCPKCRSELELNYLHCDNPKCDFTITEDTFQNFLDDFYGREIKTMAIEAVGTNRVILKPVESPTEEKCFLVMPKKTFKGKQMQVCSVVENQHFCLYYGYIRGDPGQCKWFHRLNNNECCYPKDGIRK